MHATVEGLAEGGPSTCLQLAQSRAESTAARLSDFGGKADKANL